MSYSRPLEVQMREFEVLRKLKHENIVHLHDVEEEVSMHMFVTAKQSAEIGCVEMLLFSSV